MPQRCVNSLKSEELSRTQGAVQNVTARSHLDLPVVQRLVYKLVEELNGLCSIWEVEINFQVIFKFGTNQ